MPLDLLQVNQLMFPQSGVVDVFLADVDPLPGHGDAVHAEDIEIPERRSPGWVDRLSGGFCHAKTSSPMCGASARLRFSRSRLASSSFTIVTFAVS